MRSCIKYNTVLAVNCIAAMMLAAAKLPNTKYDIANVAPVPVIRQLTVFTRLLLAKSLTIYSLYKVNIMFKLKAPFLYGFE
jgi:hypothetical protein